MGAKSHLRNVFLFHPDLMVARVEIQFGEILGSMKFIEKIIYDRYRELVLDSQFIEFPKIRTHPPITFFI